MAVQTALVGYGLGGSVFHAPQINATPDLRLTAVVSSRQEQIHRDLPGVQVVSSFETLLQDPDLQLIVLASPNHTHFDYARQALLAGKHVVVDKPFTITAAEAAELTELAARQNRVLTVFHNRRWDGSYLTLRRLLAEGALGTLYSFEARYDRFRPEWRDRWKERDDTPGAGTLYDLGAHLIDWALQLFGLPESLTADLQTQRPGGQGVDYVHLTLRYDRLRVTLRSSSVVLSPGPTFEAHGDQGSLRIFGSEQRVELVTQAEGTRTLPPDPDQHQTFYQGVADAITSGKPAPVDPAGARDVIRVIEAALRSQAEGRTVSL